MATINGTLATDVLDGTDLADIINGLAGDDYLYGLLGIDTISGGSGDDSVDGGDGSDTLLGGSGYDWLIGGAGNDILNGGTTKDIGTPASWNEVDTINYLYEGGGFGVTVNLATGTATDSFGFTDTLIDIERVWGTDFADTLTGGNVANNSLEIFVGFGGNDSINGGSGRDIIDYYSEPGQNGFMGIAVDLIAGTVRDAYGDNDTVSGIEEIRGTWNSDYLLGSNGADRFDPFGGNDFIDGRGGLDTVSYAIDVFRDGIVGIDADLARGTIIDTSSWIDTVVSIENVFGSFWSDSISGNALANVLDGDDGNDVLRGRGGNDKLYGGIGVGNDVLFGGVGNDRLEGGAGNDILRGGLGIDTFVFTKGGDEDIIKDFTTGVDKINVAAFGFASQADVLAAVQITSASTAILDLGNDVFVEFANVNTAGVYLTAGDILI